MEDSLLAWSDPEVAWFMLQRIRHALQGKNSGNLGGPGSEVEVDETLIGGKARNMHRSKRARVITGTCGKDKTVVMGMMEGGGNVRAMVVGNRRRSELQKPSGLPAREPGRTPAPRLLHRGSNAQG